MLSIGKTAYLILLCAFCGATGFAQTGVRPYTQVFSENLKGNTAIFGNTSMHIIENDTVALRKMNESGTNGGSSVYGNDNENMQFTKIDGPSGVVSHFDMGASAWRYYQPVSDFTYGSSWRTLNNPVNWGTGTAGFGYGYTQQTSIPQGNITTYYLKNVNITAPSLYTQFDFSVSFADGAIMYVNGVEVKRVNMPSGIPSFGTPANSISLTLGSAFSIPSSMFVAGNNVIAVEVHSKSAAATLSYFDMALSSVLYSPQNSSSADLTLPTGTNTIKFARLYWGGRIDNSAVVSTPDTLHRIKIRKGSTGAYTALVSPAGNLDQFAVNPAEITYQSYVDITSLIQSNGAGTYSVADIAATPGAVSGGGKYAGWCIMIAYENANLPYRSVRIYDGFSQVFNVGTGTSQTVTLTGLNVPNNQLLSSDATLSTMVWEGDANLGASVFNPSGDYMKINDVVVTNSANPGSNFWNGSISKGGNPVSTKNPNYFNQMGIDIDEMSVGTGYDIQPGATTVNVEFGTEADQYFPSVFGFSILMKSPFVTLSKTVVDENSNHILESNEILTYTLSGSNTGTGAAYNTFVVDSLPNNVTYVPNSIRIISSPGLPSAPVNQTDANDPVDFAFKGVNGNRTYIKYFIGEAATYNSGGRMPVNSSYTLELKVRSHIIPGSVINTARVTSVSEAGETFTDDGTSIISPSAAPVSVTFFAFSVALQGGNGVVNWTTENELNNDHFEVQRSDDAIHFFKRGIVPGNGTSTTVHNYLYTDNLNTNSSVIYYRLKIVTKDGEVIYSKILPLRLKGSHESFSVYPNPFTDNIKILLKASVSAAAAFRIISFDGREILKRNIDVQRGDNIIVLKDLQNIAKGAYILEINIGGEKLIQKIIRD